ncbi:MAG: lipase [Leptospirales bacterium]|nr:lipase [Leptospirales bacterium]
MRALIRQLARIALYLVLAFAGAELLLRFLQPPALNYYRNMKLLHRLSPDYLVGLAPNADIYLKHNSGRWEGRFRTNSLGYRGSAEPVAAMPKIVCQGDSLVMGFGVSDEDAFCSLLDGLTIGGLRYQTQNLGVDAFGSMGNAARLREAAHQLKNLRIALFFVSPNDFTLPQELRDRGILSDDENDEIRLQHPQMDRIFRLQFSLTRYSYVLHAAAIGQQQARINFQLSLSQLQQGLREVGWLPAAAQGPAPIGLVRYLQETFAPTVSPQAAQRTADAIPVVSCPAPIPPRFQCLAQAPDPRLLPPLPEITRRAYRQMIADAETGGYRLVFVFLPVQLEELYCTQNGRYSPFSDFILRAELFLRAEGAAIMDLRSYAKELCGETLTTPARPSIPEDYIIPGDGHLTVAGNRWAARILRAELQRMAAAHAL